MRLHNRPRAVLLASTAAAILANALPAAAQETGTPTFLGVITYFADRLGRALTDVPAHVSVIGGDEFTEQNIRTLEDLTRYIPGITAVRQVSGADPFGGQTGIRIRGVEGNRIQMMVDGARVPERIIDGSRDYLDMNFVRQADLVRGPASVLWGADALGGVLALETIGPDDLIAEGADRGGQVTVGYASPTESTNVAAAFAQDFGSVAVMLARSRTVDHELDLSNADPTGGIWDCTRPMLYGSVDCGHFNPLDRTTDRTVLRLDWEIGEAQSLSFIVDHMDRLAEVENTLAYSSTVYRNPRTRDISRTHWGATYEGQFDGFVDEVTATIGWTPGGYDQTALSVARNTLGEVVETTDFTHFSEGFLELDLQLTSRFSTGAADHVLTWGFDGDATTTDYERSRVVDNRTLGTTVASVPQSWNFADGTTTRADLFIQDTITLLDGRLELTPGLRLATYTMDPELNDSVQAIPGYDLSTREEQRLLRSLGATWNVNDTYSLWAHYGEGFKMPTFQQLFTSSDGAFFDLVPAPWLVPEEVESVELGFRGEYERGFFAVNAFRADYTNFIESFWNVPGTANYSYRNLSSVTTWGIEAETAWELSDRLEMTGSLAWMDGEQQATAGAETTPHLVPPLTAVLGASYELPGQNLTLSAHAIFAGETEPVSDLNFAPPAYRVFDIGANWAFTENASLNLSVNNLFDEKYYQLAAATATLAPSASTSNTVPPELQTGPGRNIAITLDFTF